jgi:CheY-like chemotaxis protein
MTASALSCERVARQHVRLEPRRESILLAECDAPLRFRLGDALSAVGYSVRQLATGPALLHEVERFVLPPAISEPPSALVSAIRLPGLTGIEVVSFLRCLRSNLPVIFMTAYGSMALRREAERLGAAAVLDKPFSAALLCTVLHRVLSRSR